VHTLFNIFIKKLSYVHVSIKKLCGLKMHSFIDELKNETWYIFFPNLFSIFLLFKIVIGSGEMRFDHPNDITIDYFCLFFNYFFFKKKKNTKLDPTHLHSFVVFFF
jgi:hypothetical protein